MAKNANVYDNVFKTLVNDFPHLLIPLINEMFGKNYSKDEEIILTSENEILYSGGNTDVKVADTNIMIVGKYHDKYHIECQSDKDGKMVIRMFKYDMYEALKSARIKDNTLKIKLARSAVIYLRSDEKSPDFLKVIIGIEDEKKVLEYDMPILKIKNYSIDQILEKDLLFLLPFHFFVYEGKLKEYNEDERKLSGLENELKDMMFKFESYCEKHAISKTEKESLLDLFSKVAEALSGDFEKVKKGADVRMYGKVLEYPTKTIYKEGETAGYARGETAGYAKGETAGYTRGETKGYAKGETAAYERIVANVADNLGISREEAAKLALEKQK